MALNFGWLKASYKAGKPLRNFLMKIIKDRKLIVYLARGMSGRTKEEVALEDKYDREFFEAAGFEVLSPVKEEGIHPTPEKLLASKDSMLFFWPRDKQMVRKCDIVLHMTPHLRSDGAWHEVGFKRYHLWEPVVHVYPEGQLPHKGAVSYLEDDAVVEGCIQAVEWALRVYGTRWRRLKWKIKLLKRCFLKAIETRVNWFINWI